VELTHGTLLGGRVRYAQPAHGYRTGIEPVLLAACVPARPGERVLELGTGAGAGLLCVAARVPGILGVGVERDPAQAAVAAGNFADNGFDGLSAVAADALAWRSDAVFDHAFANPPWHDSAGTASPVPGRVAAKRAGCGLLAGWASAMARHLRPRGTLTLIIPAASVAEGMAALSGAACPEIRLLPLWPRQGSPAKIVVLQGFHRGRGTCAVQAGLVLHAADGGFTDAAQAVLRAGGGLTGAG
jgi:tRNA1Val (adenine37-N6)-methyltransferase